MSFSNIRTPDRNTTTFTLQPLTVTYANTLRRLMHSHVETIGFRSAIAADGTTGDIVIEVNDTPMTNEMLAHRFGLIPIHVKDPMNFKVDNFTFKIDVRNDTDRTLDVTSEDIQVFEQRSPDSEPVRVATDVFFPADPITKRHILIATLKGKQFGQSKGEGISLKAKASLHNGRENAAFIPVSQCSYVNTPDSNPEKLRATYERWLRLAKKLSPRDIAEDDARRQALEKEFNTMEVARCYLQDERGEPYSYDFTIESVGVLSADAIIRRACTVAEGMCMRYANVDSGALPEDLTMQPTDKQMMGFDLFFQGHDYTLGYMLQTWIVENLIDGDAEPTDVVNYAGCIVPHPLHDVMRLTIGVTDGQEASARAALAAAARGCADIFRRLRAEWQAATGKTATAAATAAPTIKRKATAPAVSAVPDSAAPIKIKRK